MKQLLQEKEDLNDSCSLQTLKNAKIHLHQILTFNLNIEIFFGSSYSIGRLMWAILQRWPKCGHPTCFCGPCTFFCDEKSNIYRLLPEIWSKNVNICIKMEQFFSTLQKLQLCHHLFWIVRPVLKKNNFNLARDQKKVWPPLLYYVVLANLKLNNFDVRYLNFKSKNSSLQNY